MKIITIVSSALAGVYEASTDQEVVDKFSQITGVSFNNLDEAVLFVRRAGGSVFVNEIEPVEITEEPVVESTVVEPVTEPVVEPDGAKVYPFEGSEFTEPYVPEATIEAVVEPVVEETVVEPVVEETVVETVVEETVVEPVVEETVVEETATEEPKE